MRQKTSAWSVPASLKRTGVRLWSTNAIPDTRAAMSEWPARLELTWLDAKSKLTSRRIAETFKEFLVRTSCYQCFHSLPLLTLKQLMCTLPLFSLEAKNWPICLQWVIICVLLHDETMFLKKSFRTKRLDTDTVIDFELHVELLQKILFSLASSSKFKISGWLKVFS